MRINCPESTHAQQALGNVICYSGPLSPEVRWWGGEEPCALKAPSHIPPPSPQATLPRVPTSLKSTDLAHAIPSDSLSRHSRLRKSFSYFRIQRQSLQGSSKNIPPPSIQINLFFLWIQHHWTLDEHTVLCNPGFPRSSS